MLAHIPGQASGFVPLAVSLRRAPARVPPAHSCHSWLQYAKPARRNSWKSFSSTEWDSAPSFVPWVAKAKSKEGGKWFCGHGLPTTEQRHYREDPHSCPLTMSAMPGCSHSQSSDTAQQPHIIVWRKTVSQIPPHFIFLHHGHCVFLESFLGQPAFDRGGRLLVSKPVSFLHSACICSSVTITALKFRVAPCKEKKRHQPCLSMPSCWKKLEGISSCLRESLMHGRVCPSSAPWLHPVQRNKRIPPTAVKVKMWLQIWPKSPSLSSESVKKKKHSTETTRAFLLYYVFSPGYLFTTNLKTLLSTTVSPKHSKALGHEGHWKTFF